MFCYLASYEEKVTVTNIHFSNYNEYILYWYLYIKLYQCFLYDDFIVSHRKSYVRRKEK